MVPLNGRMRAEHRSLYEVWTIAIPSGDARSERNAGAATFFQMRNAASQNAAPMRLNIRWYIAARFAFLFVPAAEISVGTQAPMFCPMMMGIDVT